MSATGQPRLSFPIHERTTKVAPLADCSLRYIAALYDPRSCYEDPAVPYRPLLSQKVKCFARGSFTTGTTGFGFIQMRPTMFSDISVGTACSTSTSVQTAATTITAVTNTTTLANPNSPFASAIIGQTAATNVWRPVGAALYIRYDGTELNRGGDMVLLETPNHCSTENVSYNVALSYDGTKRVDISGRDWVHVNWTPNAFGNTNVGVTDECSWLTSTGLISATCPIAVFVNSAGASQPFIYEFYMWGELAGPAARSPTLSWADPIGFAAITGACTQFDQLDSVLGIEGLLKAVEAQLDNQSLPRTEHPHANFVGLLSFLPQIAALAKTAAPYVGSALKGAISGVTNRLEANGHDRPARVLKDLAKIASGRVRREERKVQ